MRKILLLLIFLNSIKFMSYATTTSGTTNRNINVTDGLIISGAANGNNSGDWELDEVFPGFQGIVNWYLTWDDNNLYIGRLGGNNLEGSLIYLRADKTGLTFSNTPQQYDNFAPNFSALDGINFIAYIKQDYDEFRVFSNGNWSLPNTSLNPAFNTPAGQANSMEVAIPWNNITGGNGKPDNIRAVLYQVAPSNFVYGESPWGNGVGTNGPNIGVNDGAPTSDTQPGGSIGVNPSITRWWGCYPVISGVGANGFIAVPPNAGNDISICSSDNSVSLNGNEPSADAIGTWTLTQAPAGANPTIVNPNLRNTSVNNFTENGIYKFVWNINYGRCPAVPDTVIVTRSQAPINAIAGIDQILDCGVDVTQVIGNDPGQQINFGGGNGTWTLAQGAGTISSPDNLTSQITNLGIGSNKFVWTITNGSCPPRKDTLEIFRFAQPIAQAGDSQIVCATSVQLNANDPIQIQATAQGSWSQVSGPTSAFFANPTLSNTTVTNLLSGVYTFKWKITNGNCITDSSQVEIYVSQQPLAQVPPDFSVCNADSIVLIGNNPLTFSAQAFGSWTLISGNPAANILNPIDSVTTINSLQPGVYFFQWKVSNGICPADSQTVRVENFASPIALAPNDVIVCGNSYILEGNDPLQIQNTATGQWSIISGNIGAQISNSSLFNSVVSNLIPGTYILQWKVSNGNCISDSVQVNLTVNTGIQAQAGIDQSFCGLTTTSLFANDVSSTLTIASWSQLSGPNAATFSSLTSNNPTLTNLIAGTYNFQWKTESPGCPSDSDIVAVQIFANPSSFLSSGAQTICGNQTTISLINPSTIQSSATGLWSQISGPSNATFSSTTNFSTNVSNLIAGNYIFNYIISNGNCDPSAKTFSLTVSNGISLNIKSLVLPEVNQSNGSIELQIPLNAAQPVEYSYNYTSSLSELIDSLSAGTYYIKVKDNAGCESDTLITLKNSFFIPTGISPNGDNMNEQWIIPGIEEFPNCVVQIFNQWGSIVYEAKAGYTVPWDGLFEGKKLPEANYFYLIDLGDGSQKLNGKITLAR
jgi:gliding motility-associated-like protein